MELSKYDDVTAIFAQMESEKAAQRARARTEETGGASTASKAVRNPRHSIEHGVIEARAVQNANTVSQSGVANRTGNCDLEMETRRRPGAGGRNNAASSSQLVAEASTSQPERARSKKRRRVA